MKKALLWVPSAVALALSLSSCTTTTSGGGPNAGPFDPVTGQYREDWADDPSKWRAPGQKPTTGSSAQIAKNDEVPVNSIPLASSGASPGKPGPSPTGSNTHPIPVQPGSQPVVVKTSPKPTVRQSVENEPVKVKPKPKPKPVLVKAKPKPKPKAVRYTVKKGDSLSAIASRTGSSVSAIKAQNGISGTLIRPGQSLVIPKR